MANNKEISKKELISIFTEIDTKISSLHKCSSEDFKVLNNYLKEYNQKIKTIFENASSIFGTIGGEKGKELQDALEKVMENISTSKSMIEKDNLHNIQILENILAKVILLIVSLKNFRQDLTTYKFLVSNYILLSGWDNMMDKDNHAIFTWEKFVKYIRTLLPSLEEKLEEIKEILYGTISKSKSFHEQTRLSSKMLLRDLQGCIQMVKIKNEEAKDSLPVLQKKTEDASKNLANIITHLQYHDIIWQKFDHIKKTHTNIITDLKGSLEEKGSSKEEDMANYYRVGDISELQAAQLILINKEYQSAIEVIIRSFQEVGLNLTAASNISRDFSFDNKSTEITQINQVKNMLDEGILVLDKANYNELVIEHNSVAELVEEFSQELSDIQKKLLGKKLQAIMSIFKDTGEEDEAQQSKRGISQIHSLADDVAKKIISLNESVGEISDLIEDLHKQEKDPIWGNQLERERINMMLSISRILNSLDEDNLSLDRLLLENKELSEKIVEEVKGTMNNVDYYDFFEKVIEDIISKLNTLNVKLYPNGKPENASREHLDDIKELYTMESERIVHMQVEGNAPDEGDAELFRDHNDDEDLELF